MHNFIIFSSQCNFFLNLSDFPQFFENIKSHVSDKLNEMLQYVSPTACSIVELHK